MNPLSLPKALVSFLDDITTDRKHRRSWVGKGRAHIEVRGLNKVDDDTLARELERALRSVDGVTLAQVNAVIGRVAIAFDPEGLSIEDLLDVIESVEELHGHSSSKFPHHRPEHPGDTQPIIRNAVAIGADVLGLGVGIFGQALRYTPFPSELALVAALADNEPRVRRFLEQNFGRTPADLSLGFANAFAQAVSQGPFGLLGDITHRANMIGELTARRYVWEKHEPRLDGEGRQVPMVPFTQEARPLPLPLGLVERYGDGAAIFSALGFGAILALTRSPRRAAHALNAGVPKAARQGREAFSAQFNRVLGQRDVVIMDREATRKLDRISAVIVDSGSLVSDRGELAQVIALGDLTEPELSENANRLFEPAQPLQLIHDGVWALGPLEALATTGTAILRSAKTKAKALSIGRLGVIGVSFQDQLVGIVALESELDPLALPLASLVRRRRLLLQVAGDQSVGRRLNAPRTTSGGRDGMYKAVRELQSEGHGVLFISDDDAHHAFVASDCGIGLVTDSKPVPWGASLLVFGGLKDCYRVVDAIEVAQQVSKRSVMMALTGSAAGAVWALAGPTSTASRRAAVPVNAAALLAQATGTVTGIVTGHRPNPVPLSQTPWHALEIPTVLKSLGTSEDGLDTAEAMRRQTSRTSELPQGLKLIQAFGAELANPLTPVLAGGAALSAAVGSLSDAVLVAGVTGANAIVGAIQRVRTETSIEKLMRADTNRVAVRRSGSIRFVEPLQLVPGDVLELAAGDVLSSDCRIIEAESCEADESALTGEPYPVHKEAFPVPGASMAERTCMLYEGATIVNGRVVAVVVAVGDETEVGRSLLDAPSPPVSGVEARLQGLTNATIPAVIVSGLAVSGLSILRGRSIRHAVTSGVSLMVAAVPEGLPVIATVAQLAVARRLSARGAIVRNPKTIEALGRVEVLCFDKTGTLTAGRIALQSISDGVRDEVVTTSLSSRLHEVLAASVRASPVANDDEVLPHATDRAVLEGASRIGISADHDLEGWLPIDELPFEPARGFHAVVGKTPQGTRICVKGAPEVVLSRCTTWRSPRGVVLLDQKERDGLDSEVERLARRGLRVLAVAERITSPHPEVDDDGVTGMELLGFLGLADIVRPTAAAAVTQLRRAGVQVVMITGDHPSTAKTIAVELGILNGGTVMSGPDMDDMTEPEFDAILNDISVFARVTPTQKVRIVRALQRAGRIVAMTGDGANDAPAIRLAHTGIALGSRCSPAARAAADLVVVDDAIETIIDAIVEGRAMWASVRDALAILVGGNLGEVAFTVAGTAISGTSPLTTRQLLLVNLLTDLLPAMTIALRPPTRKSPEAILNEGPDASLGAALTRQVIVRAVTTGGGAFGAWAIARATGTKRRAGTVALASLVATQLGQTAVIGKSSPVVLASTIVSGIVLVGVIQTPGVSQFFGCRPLGPLGWTIAFGSAATATGLSMVASHFNER